jgi:hypothetical protein
MSFWPHLTDLSAQKRSFWRRRKVVGMRAGVHVIMVGLGSDG